MRYWQCPPPASLSPKPLFLYHVHGDSQSWLAFTSCFSCVHLQPVWPVWEMFQWFLLMRRGFTHRGKKWTKLNWQQCWRCWINFLEKIVYARQVWDTKCNWMSIFCGLLLNHWRELRRPDSILSCMFNFSLSSAINDTQLVILSSLKCLKWHTKCS